MSPLIIVFSIVMLYLDCGMFMVCEDRNRIRENAFPQGTRHDVAATTAIGYGEKSFMLVWRFRQLLFGFLANNDLPRVSCQSRLSADDKGGNEMIPGLCTDLLAFILQLRKTPKNLS